MLPIYHLIFSLLWTQFKTCKREGTIWNQTSHARKYCCSKREKGKAGRSFKETHV